VPKGESVSSEGELGMRNRRKKLTKDRKTTLWGKEKSRKISTSVEGVF